MQLDKAAVAEECPFLFRKAFLPVPPRLVKRIQLLEFVDMADVSLDNVDCAGEKRKQRR